MCHILSPVFSLNVLSGSRIKKTIPSWLERWCPLVWSTSRRSSAQVNNPPSRAAGEGHPAPFPSHGHPAPFPSHGGFTGTHAEKHEGKNLPHRPPLGLCISGRRRPGTSFKPGNSVFLGPRTEGVRTAGGFVPAGGSIGDVLPPAPSLLRSGFSVGPSSRLSLSLLPCSAPSLSPPPAPSGPVLDTC